MNGGELHHLHMRNRAVRGLEPVPAHRPWMRRLDYVMYAVALCSPLALLPQVFRVFADGDIGGLALPTWLLLSAGNILWLGYGIAHREKQIILANGITLVMNLSIVIGILKYAN